ncbi:T9SS type A sorting domain-containing protein [Marinilabiliaceae bacterium ANBcel2]|nr:T9SS type A sorting domain-containing protein [Marinilabiliaceae bacterium ANBcel2]
MKTILLILGMLLMACYSKADSFYVMVNGSSKGEGSYSSPWDLQTALNHPSSLKPGDTVWIAGGTYRGTFISRIRGSEVNSIIVRAIPGEQVILDGNVEGGENHVLTIEGNNTWYWGLTITNSAYEGSAYYKGGVYARGAGTKMINCIVFNNGGVGVGFWDPAVDSEVYGCIIYHNGFSGSSRGHGHGIYAQNSSGTKTFRDNILFNSFGIGIHIYTESGSIEGFNIDRNIIFNSGLPGADFLERNIIIGGLQPADRISISNNLIYNRPAYPSKASVQLGYSADNRDAEYVGNRMYNGTLYFMREWNNVRISHNTFNSERDDMAVIAFDSFDNIKRPVINYNSYYGGTIYNRDLSSWRQYSGEDANSVYYEEPLDELYYKILKNRYEDKRAYIVVYNPGNDQDIPVDLSDIFEEGDDFKVWDVLNLEGGPVIDGLYSGEMVSIPLDLTDYEEPMRDFYDLRVYSHTLPEFGVFVVESITDILSDPSFDFITERLPLTIERCYPNPTVDILMVDFYSPASSLIRIEVFDESGRLVKHKEYSAFIGDNSVVINLIDLPGGFYMVAVSDKSSRASCKILKQEYAYQDIEFNIDEISEYD